MAEIVAIWIKRSAGGLMDRVDEAQLVAGRGVAGSVDFIDRQDDCRVRGRAEGRLRAGERSVLADEDVPAAGGPVAVTAAGHLIFWRAADEQNSSNYRE